MESKIQKRNTLHTQCKQAHKKFADFHDEITRDHGEDFLDQLVQKYIAGKITWN
ncbi:hypothetical protein [Shimazuella alba]|uniref:Uncharacterized protein n=1 Tax=Shimazuella alba TaxID=2690964 RepID=A0A6I4VW19_9BACL|nr:hypothetical protein [Shimazuella alba]MXQ54808.1 hypothetical protein [Shimazuella alba]